MAKYDPSEQDLGFNPYITDDETFKKLNYTHYSVDNYNYRNRINKWKQRENERKAFAERLGITYTPKLTPASEILKNKRK
ncbi:hypothetical protein NVP2275O_362 [Vibrio phage 2.275.O._10N.286.54.E11]|nr:hypothetical protein NVP2275O_362 [Vibrio phage 2.275.O._10N.286.54.E11]